MTPLVNYRHRYVYYFNAKSACSTYRRLFMSLHSHEKEYDEGTPHHLANRYWNPDPNQPYSDFFALTIVRNPFNRLVSAYLDKCFQWKYPERERYTNQSVSKSIHPPIFNQIGRKADYKQGFSFRELVSYLEVAIPEKTEDVHFRPQADPDIRIDAFYRLEDPIEELQRIYRSIFEQKPKMLLRFERVFQKHLRVANSVRNPSFRKEDAGMHEGPCSDFTFADFENLKMRNLRPRYSDFYDDDIAARVARLYALEIERYSYLPTPPQQSLTPI
jgi:hypothetical protein